MSVIGPKLPTINRTPSPSRAQGLRAHSPWTALRHRKRHQGRQQEEARGEASTPLKESEDEDRAAANGTSPPLGPVDSHAPPPHAPGATLLNFMCWNCLHCSQQLRTAYREKAGEAVICNTHPTPPFAFLGEEGDTHMDELQDRMQQLGVGASAVARPLEPSQKQCGLLPFRCAFFRQWWSKVACSPHHQCLCKMMRGEGDLTEAQKATQRRRKSAQADV